MATETPISRQPLIVGTREIAWRTRELSAEPAAGMVRVRARVTLLSPGTELRLFGTEQMAGEVWRAMSDLDRFTPRGPIRGGVVDGSDPADYLPVGIGYNGVYEIDAVGAGVEGLAVGQRVFVLGRHAERFDVEPWEAIPVPDEVDDATAAPAYLATLGLHALRRVAWMPGEPVVVIGLGLIGLCAALVADACGAELVCIEASPARRAVAAPLLPHARIVAPDVPREQLMAGLSRSDVRVAIDAAGGEPALRMAVSLMAPSGRIAVLALHPEPLGPLLAHEFYAHEIALVSTSNDPYVSDVPGVAHPFTRTTNVAYLLSLLRSGRVPLAGVCTHTYPAAQIADAYEALSSGARPELIGALMDWRTPLPGSTSPGGEVHA